MADRHSAFLAETLAGLTPEGRARADELLEQLAQAAGGRERLIRFAHVREAEADAGRLSTTTEEPAAAMTPQELEALTAGFMAIRDQEPLEDVARWAGAVLALLADEGGPHS